MGPLLRPDCRRLVGVDLSAGMVAKARDRGCYDSVEVGELVEWLRLRSVGGDGCTGRGGGGGGGGGGLDDGGSPEAAGFDLQVAADVLVYIGDLKPLCAAAAAAAAGPG